MEKMLVYIIIAVTGGIGGYIPVLFGANPFGGWSIFGSLVGGIAGIVIFYKMKQAGYF